jgi:hypothetical protein
MLSFFCGIICFSVLLGRQPGSSAIALYINLTLSLLLGYPYFLLLT